VGGLGGLSIMNLAEPIVEQVRKKETLFKNNKSDDSGSPHER